MSAQAPFGKRISVPPKPFGEQATESALKNSDPDIDVLADKVVEAPDDFDWLPNVPGRPAPYSHTWSAVYVALTPSGNGGWTTLCKEGCGKAIVMDGQHKELGAASTPKGRLQKPPVCHDIPWAHLNEALKEMQQNETHGVGGKKRVMSEDFKKYVCWADPTNLRPGHTDCNAAGQKETAASYQTSPSKAATAKSFVAKCATQFGNIWTS